MKSKLLVLSLLSLFAISTSITVAAEWQPHKRGSWIAEEKGLLVSGPNQSCALVVGDAPAAPISTAAELLANDIFNITGRKPEITARIPSEGTAIVFHNAEQHPVTDKSLAKWLEDQREAFQIDISAERITLTGSDARGTAYAAYELSERIGIDPLYIWTGYTPEQHDELRVDTTSFRAGTPAFRYRGFFHDDEDILPRPMHPKVDMPNPNGTIDDIWFERYFETAIRLRQNMVAPYTRTQRHHRIYEMANRYGLYLTTHHYDVLMSNVWGFKRQGLAKAQGIKPVWNFQTNAEGMERYWRNAVEKLVGMDVVWSIGMRADGDSGYKWPEGTTEADKREAYLKVHDVQMNIVKEIMGPGQEFAFTAWGEMHKLAENGVIQLPEDVMTIWSDKVPAGFMKGLPKPDAPGRHGIYYHLSILTGRNQAIQNASVVSPELIADQFSEIFAAGATEYLLVNISEIREFAREGRMLAQLSTEGGSLLDQENPAEAFRNWFSKEYFSEDAAALASEAYQGYYQLVPDAPALYSGNSACLQVIDAWEATLAGKQSKHDPANAIEALKAIIAEADALLAVIGKAKLQMTTEQARFFEENCELPARMLSQPAKAAFILNQALLEKSDFVQANQAATAELETLEAMLDAAERPPFERWYGYTWPKRSYPDTDPRLALQRLSKLAQ